MINTVGQKITPSVMTGLTAAGTSQATAFQLANNAEHEFTTVPGSAGCILPLAKLPSTVTVYNASINALGVYPPVGGTVAGGTVNAPLSLAAGAGASFWAADSGLWYSLGGGGAAGGGGGTNYYTETWDWTTKTADASNSGEVGTATGAWSATALNINTIALDGRDMTVSFTDLFVSGNDVILQLASDSTRTARYTLTGAGTSHGTWWSFPVTMVSSSGVVPSKNNNVTVAVLVKSGGGGGGTPAGASGTIQYNNAGAFGAMGALFYDPTAGVPLALPVAQPGTVQVGDWWYDSAAGGIATVRAVDGSGYKLITLDDGTFFRCGPCTAVTTSGATISLLQSPTGAWGTTQFPANALKAGQTIEMEFQGRFMGNNAGYLNFYIPAFGVQALQAYTPPNTPLATNTPFFTAFPIRMCVTAVGASGAINAFGVVRMFSTTFGVTDWFLTPDGSTAADLTVNTTVAAGFGINVYFSNTPNSFQLTNCVMRLIG
jgi:hypothetical protein